MGKQFTFLSNETPKKITSNKALLNTMCKSHQIVICHVVTTVVYLIELGKKTYHGPSEGTSYHFLCLSLTSELSPTGTVTECTRNNQTPREFDFGSDGDSNR